MWLRLRQIAALTRDLATVEAQICDILGVEVCFIDPGVGAFGLRNVLIPIGNQLLEVLEPVQDGTAAGRYLDRRGGDTGYMVITQCDDHAPRRARVEALGVRLVSDTLLGELRHMQLHPKDTGGTFFEIDEQTGPNGNDLDGPWEPAGPDWKASRRTDRVTGISAAEIQCDDPQKIAERWSEIAEVPLEVRDGILTFSMDNASLRFVPCTDGRPEGLGAIDVTTSDKAAILKAAEKHGVVTGRDQITLTGLRLNLV